ncbi:unnamed protein product [Prorocentrum cordatum]|nr:unnamed protein product [Polarella glacialis]
MAAYTFYAVISDGSNAFSQVGQTSWELSKAGASYALESAVYATVATDIATGVAATAAAATATIVAAPAVAASVGVATLWGTAMCSSMAFSSLTGSSMDWARQRMEQLGRQRRVAAARDVPAVFEGTEYVEAFCFHDVVTDEIVRDAFCEAFPTIATGDVVMTRDDAQAFFAAMDRKYSDWRVVQSFRDRFFVVTGGFSEPEPIPGTRWQRTRFAPLAFGELREESPSALSRLLSGLRSGGEK